MKLRNKKTGEIVEICKICPEPYEARDFACNSLAELNEEWEDAAEEPKWYWYIDDVGVMQIDQVLSSEINMRKSIGNYFETREEAEKAVEKLRAFKRLKDKGFKFTGVAGIPNNIFVSFESDSKYESGHIMYDEYSNTDNKLKEYNEDLMFLFGGEEQ